MKKNLIKSEVSKNGFSAEIEKNGGCWVQTEIHNLAQKRNGATPRKIWKSAAWCAKNQATKAGRFYFGKGGNMARAIVSE